jgi:type II secretory pathway predicted ATPase ExeA
MKTATLTAFALMVLLGTASAQPSTKPAPVPVATTGTTAEAGTAADYRLAAGDKLRIEVYKDAQLSQSLQIRPDGKITLPLVGDIAAAGRTPIELRDAIGGALKDYITNPVVTVIVTDATPPPVPVVYVTGEVNKPGALSLTIGPMSVLQAIAMAGGFTDFANRKDIRILRTHRAERATFGLDVSRSYVPSLAFGGTNQAEEVKGFIQNLRYGVESHAGFVVITGEIGSGKTTLLQTLLRNLDSQTTVGRIVNTMLEPRELLETILIDFGLDPAGRSKPLLLRDLSQYLVDQRLAGRLVLLVIDEAQNLGLGALEELRTLSNLETEKSKLLQIVLVGQPNLRDKLAAPELEQLRQRMTVSYHLRSLDAEETGRYIHHRLRHAALGAPMEFPLEATNLIHARSGGAGKMAAEAEARTITLQRREQAVPARERELAEQRRVLAEEYRLLRTQSALSPVEGPPLNPIPMAPVAAPRATRFDAVHVEGFWDRLKRIMLGVSVS